MAGLAAVAQGGCAGLRFERPQLELEALQVTGLGFTGGSLNLMLDVYNPNAYSLRTTRLELAVDLDQTPFGDAVLGADIELPAQASTSIELPVRFSWSGLGAGARAMLARGSIPYDLNGRVWVDTPIGNRSVRLHSAGTVSISDLVGRDDL